MDAGTPEALAFPKEEYERRVARLQERMRALGLDAALGAAGGVTLIGPPDVYAAPTASVARLVRWDRGETTCTKAAVASVRECIGSRRARIGIELGWGSRLEMCQEEAGDLRAALGCPETVDIAPVLWQLRARKSPAEIEKVAQACALTDRAFVEILPSIEPGVSELEIENRFSRRMTDLGGEAGFLDVVMGLERHLWANNLSRPDRFLNPDDIVSVDGGCCVDGYHCDICRMFSVNRPADDVLRIIEAITAANRATTARLDPGMRGDAAYAVCADEMKRHGLGDILNPQAVAHSVGLDIHEPPECGPGSDQPLLDHMTVCVEPWSVHPDLGLFNVEDVVALQGARARRLTSLPQGIYCIQEKSWLGCE